MNIQNVVMLMEEIVGLTHSDPSTSYIEISGGKPFNRSLRIYEGDSYVIVMKGFAPCYRGVWMDTIEEYLTNWRDFVYKREMRNCPTIDYRVPYEKPWEKYELMSEEIFLKLSVTLNGYAKNQVLDGAKTLRLFPLIDEHRDFLPMVEEGENRYLVVRDDSYIYGLNKEDNRLWDVSSYFVYQALERGKI